MVYTENIEFDWDDRKAESNYKKHGVTFEEAALALTDPDSYFEKDEKHSSSTELRLKVTGEYSKSLLIFIVVTMREEKIRIISARKTNEKEKEKYRKNRLLRNS